MLCVRCVFLSLLSDRAVTGALPSYGPSRERERKRDTAEKVTYTQKRDRKKANQEEDKVCLDS